MPAYFDITFSYEYSCLHPNFVNQIYSIFFNNGFAFKQANNEDITLKEIIEWNQSRLEKKFKLGYTQNAKYDYKQVCFTRDGYEELRAFWIYSNNEINLTLITPEYDVFVNDYSEAGFLFRNSKLIPFIELSKEIWSDTNVTAIQTALEFDGGVKRLSKLLSGKEEPLVHPFAIVKSEIYKELSDLDSQYIQKEGILLIDKKLIQVTKD
jgi:hypothetical protein